MLACLIASAPAFVAIRGVGLPVLGGEVPLEAPFKDIASFQSMYQSGRAARGGREPLRSGSGSAAPSSRRCQSIWASECGASPSRPGQVCSRAHPKRPISGNPCLAPPLRFYNICIAIDVRGYPEHIAGWHPALLQHLPPPPNLIPTPGFHAPPAAPWHARSSSAAADLSA